MNNIYQFKNTIKNQQVWKRSFVAETREDAIKIAKTWEIEMNKTNDFLPTLLIQFDYIDIDIIEHVDQEEGYIEV